MESTCGSDLRIQKIERMISQAWGKLSAGDKIGATVKFAESAEEAKRVTVQSSQLAQCLWEVGVGLFMIGPAHDHNAVLYLTQALRIYTRELGAGSIECGRIHRQMSAIFASSGMHQQSLTSLRRAVEIFETLLTPNFGVDAESSKDIRLKQLSTRMEQFANARANL